MTSYTDATNVRSLTIDQLKIELRSKNLPVKGKKAELRKRLMNRMVQEVTEPEGKTTCNTSEFLSDFDLFVQE